MKNMILSLVLILTAAVAHAGQSKMSVCPDDQSLLKKMTVEYTAATVSFTYFNGPALISKGYAAVETETLPLVTVSTDSLGGLGLTYTDSKGVHETVILYSDRVITNEGDILTTAACK